MDAWPQKVTSNVERNADVQAEEGDCEANDDEDDADEDEEEDEDDDEEVGGCPLDTIYNPSDVVYEIVAEQSSREPALLDDGWVSTSVVRPMH